MLAGLRNLVGHSTVLLGTALLLMKYSTILLEYRLLWLGVKRRLIGREHALDVERRRAAGAIELLVHVYQLNL